MSKQSEHSANPQLNNHIDQNSEPVVSSKRPFVEPEISSAVDVLEATTFFQSATSGATN